MPEHLQTEDQESETVGPDLDVSVDPPAADHDIAVVEHHRLTRRDGDLRRVEDDLGASRRRASATVAGAA